VYASYITDDSFIYAQFARNLATHGELSFAVGEPVHAATSPLWAALGALGVFVGIDAFLALKWLGMLCGLAALFAFSRAARAWLGDSAAAGWVTFAMATEIWFVRWSSSAMETPLAVLFVCCILWLAATPPRGQRLLWLAAIAGLAPLARPELALLSALIALRVAADEDARTKARFWIVLALPMLLWSSFALSEYGHIWPATLRAKSTPFGLQPARLLSNIVVLAKLIGLAAALPALAMLWSGLRRCVRAPREFLGPSWLTPVLWAWSIGLLTVYLLRDVQVVSRYLEILLPAILLLGAQALRDRSWSGRAWALQIAVGLAMTVFWVGPSTRAFSNSIDVALGDISDWLNANTEPGTELAIYDIGIVGYRSHCKILDLGGLVDPRINVLRDRVDDSEILREGLFFSHGEPRYLVDRDAQPEALKLKGVGGRKLSPILTRSVKNLGLSRSEPVHYTLYRVDVD
jgi:hypothetical protein